MPLALAIGYKAAGRDAEPTLLYCGLDASAAQEAAKKATGFVRVDYLKAPIVTKRVFHEVPAAAPAPAPAPAPAAEEPAADDEPAKSSKSKAKG